MNGTDAITARIERTTKRLAQLQARKALREMRLATQSRARARRQDARRKYEMGEAVLRVGLADWPVAEIIGILLDGKDRFGHSPTMRMSLRKQGAAYLDATRSEDGARCDPPSP